MKLITSWDDGHPLDLKLVKLLEKYSVEATFYIPIKASDNSPVMSSKDIKEIAEQFHVGAHTYNHVKLTQVSFDTAYKEIYDGKIALEDIVQDKLETFSFPCGFYNDDIVKIVEKIGFKEARSARLINYNQNKQNSFVRHPNLHFFNHKIIVDILHCLKHNDYYSLKKRFLGIKYKHIDLYKIPTLFEDNIMHIWGHSWEIEKYGLWNKLEEVFKYYDSIKNKNLDYINIGEK